MDDEDLVRETISAMLGLLGYEITPVKTGHEALEAYRQAKVSGAPFDVVILDLVVEGALGGVETLQVLKTIDPEVRAVASSGYAKGMALSEMRDLGFTATVAKPYRMQDLKETLEAVLGTRPVS